MSTESKTRTAPPRKRITSPTGLPMAPVIGPDDLGGWDAEREWVVGIHADLRGQVEGDGEAGLPLGEVLAVELVGFRSRGMA